MTAARKFAIMVLLTVGWMIVLAPVFVWLTMGALRMGARQPGSYLPDTDLPGGYKLMSYWGGDATSIIGWSPDPPVYVGPGVDGYQVIAGIAVGHVSCSIDGGRCEPGYFVLDTRTGKVQQGLGRAAWLKALRNVGIAAEPKLHR